MAKYVLTLVFTSLLSWALQLNAQQQAGRFSQMVMTFPERRAFDYAYHERDHALVLHIQNTLTDELKPIYHYDETLIRRVLIREKNQKDTEIRLILRDANVRASVYSFDEPFRIVIDLFDQDFQEHRDPQTGLPLAHGTTSTEPTSNRLTTNDKTRRQPRNQLQQPRKEPSPKRTLARDPAAQTSRRRLLQAPPPDLNHPHKLRQNLAKTPAGTGQAWQRFPIYIYRLQTEPYKTGKSYESWLKSQSDDALASAAAMANYAGQLFDFGHENRALLAYQKVLHQSPLVFDRRADHLWRLAEIHFGQGNLTLADGYYSSLIDKHPDHPLSHFGKLRRLDISAIKALDGEQADQFNKIAAKLDQIRTKDLPELAAQIAIRQAYWRQPAAAINQHGPRQRWLPTLTPERRVELSAVSQHVENPKTAFLIDSLTLNSYLDQPDSWDNRATRFAGEYFKRFQGGAAEPFRDTLQQKTRNLLKTRLQKLVDNGQLLKAIELFESLPQGLERIGEAPATAWAMAQAYRKLQQPEQAAKLYKQAGDQMGVSPKKFRALFWRLESLVKQLAIAKSENSPTARIRQLEDHIRSTDEQGLQVWEKLKNSERGMLFTALQPELEAGLNETALTKTHPNLVHWAWSGRLTTAAAGGTTSNQQIGDGLNPSRQTVYLLSDLAKRFGQLGQAGKQQEAKNLLRFMSPADFNGDDQAAKLWAQELVNLAETYRRNNQYLKAGRLYTLTGEKSQNWEKRAEALYKGGLLLYRSGRREEAIKAFNEAANDGNNLLYAELAQKRLEQLNE